MNDKELEQRRIVKSAVTTCLGWLLLIALFIGSYSAIEPLLRRLSVSPAGADVLVFANFRRVANEMFAGAAFTLVILVFGVTRVKSTGGAVIAALVVVSGCSALGFQVWYARFAALRVRPDNSIELQYLWPRGRIVMQAASVRSLREIDSREVAYGPTLEMYQLEIETAAGCYRSMRTSSHAQVREAMERIRRLNASAGVIAGGRNSEADANKRMTPSWVGLRCSISAEAIFGPWVRGGVVPA